MALKIGMKGIAAAALIWVISTVPAHAACNSPPGGAGDQIYNSTHNVMQYCNGNLWIAMGSGGGGSGSDTLGDLACNNAETIEFDGTNWNCVGGKVSRTGDTMTGTLDVAAPTAGTHATTKAYVDAAIAGVAGASGGGGGATCYYANGTCGSGFDQMPGNFRNDGVTHNVCCTGGGSLVDEMPATFDFPASPAIAGTAAHTWSPQEISGFESASVSIQVSPNAGLAEFRICADSACSNVLKGWRNTSTGIASGNYLQIRIGANTNTRSQDAKITITVGGMSDDAPITSTIPGSYFLAFVTNDTWNGNLGNISGADAKCQNAAAAAGLGGTFKAWISSTNANRPIDRFENVGTTSAFYMPNGSGGGVKLVDNWADLVDNTLDTQFNRTETGAVRGSANVWTNTNAAGGNISTAASTNCSSFTGSGGSQESIYGRTDQVGSGYWSNYNGNTYTCPSVLSLYCFQTVLPN